MSSSQSVTIGTIELPKELFAAEVFHRYATRLARAADQRLSRQLRRKVEPEDVVQSAFRSFFRCINDFRLEDEDGGDAIWALLLVITLRKCKRCEEIYRSHKRSVLRETERQSPAQFTAPTGRTSPQVSPVEDAIAADLLDTLLSKFDSRRQSMILLRIQGHDLEEIAQRCESSRRTVARTVAEAKLELSKILSL